MIYNKIINEILKYIWLWAALFCVFALIASIPAVKYQKILRQYIMKKRFAPQVRTDVTQRYLEAVESGEISDVYLYGYAPEYIKMYEAELDAKFSTIRLLPPPPAPA